MSIEKADMLIITKEHTPYTVVNTKVVQSITNLEALAIWVYLLSLPPEWKVRKSQLKQHFGFGDHRLKCAMAYLRKCNLIEYAKAIAQDGKFIETTVNVKWGSEFVIYQEDKKCATTGSESDPLAAIECANPLGRKTTGSEIAPLINIYTKQKENKDQKLSCASDDARQCDDFEEFWKIYPKKKDKNRAKERWKKIDQNTRKLILEKVKQQVANDRQWQEQQFIPLPSTYLNGKRWEDEIETVQIKSPIPIKQPYNSLQAMQTKSTVPFFNPDQLAPTGNISPLLADFVGAGGNKNGH